MLDLSTGGTHEMNNIIATHDYNLKSMDGSVETPSLFSVARQSELPNIGS